MTGRMVWNQEVNVFPGETNVGIDVSDFAKGMYVYSISNELGIITKKLIVE